MKYSASECIQLFIFDDVFALDKTYAFSFFKISEA